MPDVSIADPVATAKSLASLIDSEAHAAEQATTMTTPVVDAFKKAGLFYVMVPTQFGGANSDVWTTVETIEAVSRGDAATGWAYMANAIAGGSLSTRLGDEALKDIFLGGELGIIAGMTAPSGVATMVDGGFMIDGKMSFASGSGHASWIAGGAMVTTDNAREPLIYVVPRESAECLGNWDVQGLVATGSYDFAVHKQFVPAEYCFYVNGAGPSSSGDGRAVQIERRFHPSLYMDRFAIATCGHLAVALGTAAHALEELVKVVDAGKQRPNAPAIRDQQLFQHGFAVAEAKFRSSRAYAKEVITAAQDSLIAGAPTTTPLETHRIYQACCFGVQCATEVVDFAYYWAGSQALRRPHPLGRIQRDMRMAENIHLYVDTSVMCSTAPSILASYRTS